MMLHATIVVVSRAAHYCINVVASSITCEILYCHRQPIVVLSAAPHANMSVAPLNNIFPTQVIFIACISTLSLSQGPHGCKESAHEALNDAMSKLKGVVCNMLFVMCNTSH